MQKKISDTIREMETVYASARDELNTLHEAERSRAETEKRVRTDIHMVEADRAAKLRELSSEAFRLRDKLAAIEEKTHRQLDELARTVTTVTVDPEQIDQKALMLIDSGAMTADELLAFGDRYKGNPTMQRLVSQRLVTIGEDERGRFDRRTGEALRMKGRELAILSQSAPGAEIIDNILTMMKHGSRADAALADGIHSQMHDGVLADALAAAAELDAAKA